MYRALRMAAALAAVAVMASTATAAASAAAPLSPLPAEQRLAVLNHDTGAFATPSLLSRRVTELSDTRPITGERTVLPVIAVARGPRGMLWLRVRLPGRPDSHTGWIREKATTRASTGWRLIVRLSAFTVTVIHDGHVARALLAVVGKPSTPTPTGQFFVEEDVKLDATQSGAPYALALSARSNALQEFDGGPGQIALHGTGNIGGIPGTAVSHGCMRLDDADITWLAEHIGPGVPVDITP